ncbi:MAG: phosphatidate cytidylyltransferase [Anaerolineales bacterium]
MLSQRVKAALIFTPLVLILIYIGGWIFNSFFTIILLLAAFEYTRLFRKIGTNPSTPILCMGILLFILNQWLFKGEQLGITMTVVIFLVALVALIQFERQEPNTAENFAITLSGILYLGWVGSAFIPFRAMDSGRGWVLTALPSVWIADSGAYFIGRWLGKAKMTPHLSPGKTWAGLIGAVITGTLSGFLLILLWRSVGFLPATTPLWQGVVMGLILAILTPIGDLLISLLKRSAGVKDTGDLIPGHGGVLDRIDTWIWAALLGYYLVQSFA